MNNTKRNVETPLILVTNDDGINSPGLLAAVEVARRLGDVLVAAPTTQQTAMGRSLTGSRDDFFHAIDLPLVPSSHAVTARHINASPALTVRHALAVLCSDRRPDLVISGINYGENLGNNVTMSGTVGAALQAAAEGIPALAVSRQTEIAHHFAYGDLDWTDAIRVTAGWAQRVLDHTRNARRPFDLLGFEVLKIDVPDPCPPGTEERITRPAAAPYFLSRISVPEADTPISAAETFVNPDRSELIPEDDIYAITVDRVASITPLQLSNGAPIEAAKKFFGSSIIGI